MPSAGFQLTIPATKLRQTYALGRAATEIGLLYSLHVFINNIDATHNLVLYKQVLITEHHWIIVKHNET
jgi:hypothetical protein